MNGGPANEGRPAPPPVAADGLVAQVVAVDKRFGSVQALQRLHINIPQSKITVLLGPNGAGKTTAIRMITGAMVPDSGSVSVFGADPAGQSGEEIRRRCGIVSAKPSLYDRLSGLDNLRYAAELYDLGRGKSVDRRIGEAAAQFGIEQALKQRVGGYSTGMKTRLALARSILHDPDLLLLDEPTSGLDPESAVAVLRMVREMTGQGRTVLMCTHLLLEAEGLADEVVIIQDGTSLMWGDPEKLSRRYWPRPEVTITAAVDSDLSQINQFPEVVNSELLTGASSGDAVRIMLRDERDTGTIIHRLIAAGVSLRSVVPYKPSLEDLYFAVRREHRIDHGGSTTDPLWDKMEQSTPGGSVTGRQPVATADDGSGPSTADSFAGMEPISSPTQTNAVAPTSNVGVGQ